MEWVKTRRGRSQLYMLVIDVAQLVIDKNCITKVLLLKIQGVRAPLAHPSKSVADMVEEGKKDRQMHHSCKNRVFSLKSVHLFSQLITFILLDFSLHCFSYVSILLSAEKMLYNLFSSVGTQAPLLLKRGTRSDQKQTIQ